MAKDSKQQEVLKDEALLEFTVGPFRFCAPALDVEAIISPPDMIQVPLSTDIVAGCFVHQNRTVTVLSMHNKFGLPFTRNENETHIILATVDNGLKGFWVDQAIEVMQLNSLNNITDYYLHEDKAYSSFLARDEDILLKTSFQRLYRCARSRLYWTACLETSKTVAVSEDDSATLATMGAVSSSGISKKDQAAVAANTAQPGTIDTDNNDIAAKPAVNNRINSINSNDDETSDAKSVARHTKPSSEQAAHKLVANADYTANSHPVIKQKSDETPHSEGAISNKLTHPYKKADNTGVAAPASNPYRQNTSSPGPAGSRHRTAINKPASSEGAATKHTNTSTKNDRLPAAASYAYSPSRLLSEVPDASSDHSSTARDAMRTQQWQAQSYNRNATSKSDHENNKRNLLPLAAALLALCALGLGSMYLLDDGAGPAIKHPGKVTGTRESSPYTAARTTDKPPEQHASASESGAGQNTVGTNTATANNADMESHNNDNQADHSMDTANLIESTPADTAQLEKDTLNELAQADAIAVPSTNPRVIELHVNEQPDSPLAAITNPEPVTHQQYSVLGIQEFTHIVVKGDTLWHITWRYLGNPYRYPELAESSQINNPHLIYPGDVIRITVNRKKGL